MVPVLFEKGDIFDIRYQIKKEGLISFDEYMFFLHEAFTSDNLNVENPYSGTWQFHI